MNEYFSQIPYLIFKHPVEEDSISLMLDTGSELNFSKIKKIHSLQTVNTEKTGFLKQFLVYL